jgi:outer membrane protein assembly factor BamB
VDGGIDLYRLDPKTGNTLSRTSIYSPDPVTGKQPKHTAPAVMPGARADILTGDGNCVYLRDMVFDERGTELTEGKAHLFTLTDFLDDSWPHRSYWIFGTQCSIATGCSSRDKKLVFGRLLVFDESDIYGYGRGQVHWSNQLQDGAYRLFAVSRDDGTTRWQKPVKFQVRAMVLAGEILFAAGPILTDPDDAPQAPAENRESLLLAISASDGTELAQYRLDSAPIFDGMAAAFGRLYISMMDGSVLCMGRE